MDETDLRAYVGLLILAGVYRSPGEAAASLWDAESGRPIFRATMPLKLFHTYSRLLRLERGQGMRVVLDVTEGLHGRNITCDNYFTSYELARQLLERKITVVGKGREVFSSKFAFRSTATLVSYMPKKNRNVVLLSTRHAEAGDSEDKKPVIVLDYNRNKGGVDNLDKVIGTYRRMTASWPLVVFHNIINVSSYNAFVIWRKIQPDWMPGKRNKRRVFLQELGKALVTPFIAQRERTPRTKASAAVVRAVKATTAATQRALYPGGARPKRPASIALAAAAPLRVSKRKRCQMCPRKKDCKTHTVCRRCNKYICKDCSLVYCPTCVS